MILLPSEFLEKNKTLPIIDVRTPAEFEQGHIPGAFNLPLFTNEERAIIGTLYKKESKEIAFMKGLDFVGTKMSSFVKSARKIAINSEILIHCWRGGMRSASMAWLLKTAGFEAHTLQGGYKAYRNFIRKSFDIPSKMLVLGGYTGSGKTEILKYISEEQIQIIDLEAIANHKGSVFGHIGQLPQPSNEQFENDLASKWAEMDLTLPICLEDESRSIGHVSLPDNFYDNLRNSVTIFVYVPKEARIQRLVKEYSGINQQALKDSLLKLIRRLGGQNYKKAMEALQNNDFSTVADITLSYYDKAYFHGLEQRESSKVFSIKVDDDNPKATAKKVLDFYQSFA